MYLSNLTELPKPDLGDLSDMKATTVQVQKKKNPTILGLKYEQLVAIDTISVDLVPEKKGILLKHNEYSVHSQVHFIFLPSVHFLLQLNRRYHMALQRSELYLQVLSTFLTSEQFYLGARHLVYATV